MRDHHLDPDNPTSFLYLEHGRPYLATEAIIRIVAGLGGGWRTVAAARLIPAWIMDAAYAVIARNRYRRFERTESCVVPTEDLRQRFLDWPEMPHRLPATGC